MLSKFSVKKPFTVLVGVVMVIVFGVVSLYKMTPELFPNIDTPYVIVMTTYPGASPEEAETEITKPMEQQLATLSNLKDINSVSGDSYSMVQMEFTDGCDMDTVTVDIDQKINQIEGNLPDSASSPVVMKMGMDIMPTVVAAVEMGDKSEAEISKIVNDDLMTPLKGTDGVASVNAMGLVDSNIQVVLSQKKIDKVNKEVSAAVGKQFNSAESKIKSGVSKAKSGQKKVKSGESAIQKGQASAAKQFASTRTKLKESKEKLKEQKGNLEELKKQYETYKDDPINGPKIIQKINASVGSVDKLDSSIKQATTQISSIDKALDQLTADESTLNFDLNSKYSKLTSTESTLTSTISQLQNSLSDIQSQKESALQSADLSSVLTMDNISTILNAQNFSMPAGYVSEGDSRILVSVGDKIKDKTELENLVLFDPGVDGVDAITLGDVATVSYGSGDTQTYAKINGKNGICLSFSKQSTYATATVSQNITDKFKTLEDKYRGLHFVSLYNGGDYINLVINSVLQNLLLGAILAMIILFLFLRDIRPTIITAISIPLSVVFAIVLMYFSGVTLNMVSLAGLAIGVGMLVDNSIVVVENIFRLRTLGYSRVQSAVSGAVQVAGAITASTLTTICVFVPIIFVTGMTRDIFQDLALTVTYSLLASLIIALTLVPAMAKGMLKGDGSKAILKQNGIIIGKYKQIASWALRHKKVTLALALVILVGSVGLALSRGFEFMPAMSTPQISASITMDDDSKISDTSEACDDISDQIRKIDGVEDVGVMLSSSTLSMLGMDTDTTDVTKATMYIIMDENKLDNVSKVSNKLEKLAKIHNCEIITSADMDLTSMMGESDVSFTVYSDDLDALRSTASKIEGVMKKTKGLEDVSDVDKDSSKEIKIVVNKNKAMKKGLTVAQVYKEVSAKLTENKTATSLTKDSDTIDVVVENTTKNKFSKRDLKHMKISVTDSATNKTTKIKLADVVTFKEDASLNEINHNNQKRSQSVTATVSDGYNVTKITNKLKQSIKSQSLIPSSVDVDYGGQNEEIMDAMKQMGLMLVVGFILIYLVMVAQFQSLRSPFIIIFTVPLAFTGGMLGLLITGQVVSIVSMMGFVMLMGIIVNNGIVLVDTINRFRLEGMGINQAIINAGAVRMRPILMTAVTTVLGLIPLAIGFGTGAEMMRPVAIVCIGGLIYATLTTLIVIPIMYKLLSRKNMSRIRNEELEIIKE